MFGYIRPFQPELRIKEYEAYKSVYCGLCKELGRQYGIFARFTLSYDFTFLAILSMAVQKVQPEFGKIRCLINPLKKCSACHKDGITDRIAAQAMITLYYKCQDQLSDENFALRLPVRVALPFFRHCWRKARQKDEEYDRSVSDMVQAQQFVESQRRDLIRRRNLLLGIYPSLVRHYQMIHLKNGSYPDSDTFWDVMFIFLTHWTIWKKMRKRIGLTHFYNLIAFVN